MKKTNLTLKQKEGNTSYKKLRQELFGFFYEKK